MASNYEQTNPGDADGPLALSDGVFMFTYKDNDKFKGFWADRKKHGLGVLSLADGSKYRGEFIEGWNEGHGVMTFNDKSVYEGSWVDGKFQGYGVFTLKDGTKYSGEFQKGKIEGQGTWTFPKGLNIGEVGMPRQEGFFKDGKLIRPGKAMDALTKAMDAQEMAIRAAKSADEVK